jgi:hypothetical protein
VRLAKHYKEQTAKHAGWQDLFIVHKADHSALYWGSYQTLAGAQRNLRRSKTYRTARGVQVYAAAMAVSLPGETPERPAWRLDKTPEEYVFTVLLAVFYDVPEAQYVGRKEFALDYCRQLRSQKEDAYYLHGKHWSIVTVGRFPRSAVKITKLERTVVGVVERQHASGYDKKVVLRPTGEPTDPRIKAIFRKHPDLAVNGRQRIIKTVDRKTGKIVRMPDSTYLIVIPREKATHAPAARRPRPKDHPGHAESR